MTPDDDDVFLDGSSAAGALAEIFAMDVTAAEGTCAGCGRTGTIAQTRVYGRLPGLVLRCAGCSHVLARIVSTARHVTFDLSGFSRIRVLRPAET